MIDNHIYLFIDRTIIRFEIKHDASTKELYSKINDLINCYNIKILVYKNKPIKSAVNITLRDYNIHNDGYIEIRN